MSISKYDSGLFYKMCLFSDSDNWIDGKFPGGKGELLAAISINAAIKQIDIAIDKSIETSKMVSVIEDKIYEGFNKLGLGMSDMLEYNRYYQSTNGTQLIPSFKRINHKEPSIFAKLFKK